MSYEVNAIADWLDSYHCDSISCVKTTCQLCRSLAEQIRNGDFR